MVQKGHKYTHMCTETAKGKAINLTPTSILKEGCSGGVFTGLITGVTHGAKLFSLAQEFVRHVTVVTKSDRLLENSCFPKELVLSPEHNCVLKETKSIENLHNRHRQPTQVYRRNVAHHR